MDVYSPDTLAKHTGDDGKTALVAVDGKVYDVSSSKKWKNGKHMNRHNAGADLSTEIKGAPHGAQVLERFECVGRFEEAEPEPVAGLKGSVLRFVDRHPFFRRHPHPAVVHMPVGLMVAAPILMVASLIYGSLDTEWAAFCTLLLAVIFLPPAIATGYFTWWINYELVDSPTIRWKRRLAWTALAVAVVTVVVRLAVVNPLALNDPLALIYLGGLLGSAGVTSLVGFLGGTLTFPLE